MNGGDAQIFITKMDETKPLSLESLHIAWDPSFRKPLECSENRQ